MKIAIQPTYKIQAKNTASIVQNKAVLTNQNIGDTFTNKSKNLSFNGHFPQITQKTDGLFTCEEHFDTFMEPHLLNPEKYMATIGMLATKEGKEPINLKGKIESSNYHTITANDFIPLPSFEEYVKRSKQEALEFIHKNREKLEAEEEKEKLKEWKEMSIKDKFTSLTDGFWGSGYRNIDTNIDSLFSLGFMENRHRFEYAQLRGEREGKQPVIDFVKGSYLHKEAVMGRADEEKRLAALAQAKESYFDAKVRKEITEQHSVTYGTNSSTTGNIGVSIGDSSAFSIGGSHTRGKSESWKTPNYDAIDTVRAENVIERVHISQAQQKIESEFRKRINIANANHSIKEHLVKGDLSLPELFNALRKLVIKDLRR